MHRRIAARLAWRKRMAIAFGLLAAGSGLFALTGGPAWLLLPLLSLFYPARWEEGRALLYLDRFGLAYRTWLETDPRDPLRPELSRAARTQEARTPLPRFPLREGILFVLLWTALGLGLPRLGVVPGVGSTGPPPAPAREITPQPGHDRGGDGATPEAAEPRVREAEGAAPRPDSDPPASGERPQSRPRGVEGEPEAPVEGEQREAARPEAGASTASKPEGQGAGAPPPEGAEREPAAARPGQEKGAGIPPGEAVAEGAEAATPGEGSGAREAREPGPAKGATGAVGEGTPGAVAPLPRAAAGGEEGRLPTPWPEGKPPEAVLRRAERYLGEVPLTPAQRRVLEAYFGLSGSSP